MKFIPILFQTLMVQATIAGRKTMTRRLKGLETINQHPDEWEWINKKMVKTCRFFTDEETNPNPLKVQFVLTNKETAEDLLVKCPYGKEGDILWGRETVYPRYVKGGYEGFRGQYPNEHPYRYYADDPNVSTAGYGWKPSIHMPKTACRIFLEITTITVERLRAITPGDACDEGINYWNIDREMFEGGELVADYENYAWKDDPNYEDYHFPTYSNPIDSFRSLWQKINGAESWNANPWVWVISFKKISKPENFI